jgi:hypothetical protein
MSSDSERYLNEHGEEGATQPRADSGDERSAEGKGSEGYMGVKQWGASGRRRPKTQAREKGERDGEGAWREKAPKDELIGTKGVRTRLSQARTCIASRVSLVTCQISRGE